MVHTRRGVRADAQKFIYNKHIPSLYNDFLKLNPDVKTSVSTYCNCKPFYVSPANQREMEACMCSKCLNPHSLYEAIRQNICGLPYSLTKYLQIHLNIQKIPILTIRNWNVSKEFANK